MKQTFHVGLNVFPLRLTIKNCGYPTRGLYQIRPGKANYTDNNLLLYCCRHVSYTEQHIPETCQAGRRATEERRRIRIHKASVSSWSLSWQKRSCCLWELCTFLAIWYNIIKKKKTLIQMQKHTYFTVSRNGQLVKTMGEPNHYCRPYKCYTEGAMEVDCKEELEELMS